MEFTESIPAFGGKAVLSPNGRHLARIAPSNEFILLIQDTDSLTVTLSVSVPLLKDNDEAVGLLRSRHFPPPKPRKLAPGDISLAWSPDSSKVMIVDGPVNRIFVYEREGEPDDGGLVLQETLPTRRFLWAPDSAHILSVLDHRIGLRVWSLNCRYPVRSIANIKSSNGGLDFSQEGSIMAVLHRKDAQDYIVIYNCVTWSPVQVLHPPESSLLGEVKFARGPHSQNTALERPLLYAWDIACISSRLLIFDPDGSCKVVDVFCGQSDFQESFGFSAFFPGPTSDLAAFVANDGSIVLWNWLLQRPLTKFFVNAEIAKQPALIAFKERVAHSEDAKFVRYESGYDLMLTELQSRNGAAQLIPTISVKFSADSRHLAIHSSLFPNHLWIYHVPSLAFTSVLCQIPFGTVGSIKDFDWHPELPILGLVTGSEYVYFWQPEGCHCIPQPFTDREERCSRTFQWNRQQADKHMMLLTGTSSCCLALPDFIISGY